jgi:membrane-associated phospholipid phosphatase
LVALGTLADPSWATAIDDLTPVIEAMVITQWVTRAIKIPVGRQRPYAHYTAPADYEDNLSFPSGHTSRAFSLAVSAAMIARARGYRSEPYIWTLGFTAASASAYLRIAADRHYLTDVLAGAAIGIGTGLTVPSLMCRNALSVVPVRDGVALAGVW